MISSSLSGLNSDLLGFKDQIPSTKTLPMVANADH